MIAHYLTRVRCDMLKAIKLRNSFAFDYRPRAPTLQHDLLLLTIPSFVRKITETANTPTVCCVAWAG